MNETMRECLDTSSEKITEYILRGIKSPNNLRLGLEIEHFVLDQDDYGVSYYGENGVEQILRELSPYYNKELYGKDNHLIGLVRKNIDVTLEPGSQLEVAIGPFAEPAEFEQYYNTFLAELTPILDKYGYHLGNYGYQPKTLKSDVKVIPKLRYDEMNEYLGKSGQFGQNMMRCSASTQVSFDFVSFNDLVTKLRISYALAPIFEYYFNSSPFFEGTPSKYKLLRSHLWRNLDDSRTGIIPKLFSPDFSLTDYAEYALNTPVMTRKHDDDISNEEFLLSTLFTNVRLKQFIELRTVDSLPIKPALKFLKIVKNLFYNAENLQTLAKLLKNVDESVILEVEDMFENLTDDTLIYGQRYVFWQNLFERGVFDQ